MATNQMGLVSKSKLTALATAIKTKAGVSGTYTLDDLVDVVDDIEAGGVTPTGTKQVSITQNGTTTEDVTNYASAEITVNVPSSGITPTGTINITENGTVDVTQYASAEVNVSGGGGASWVTVAEQALAEDAAEIVLSGISGTYDVYEITLVGQTSAAEWIYPIFTSSGSKGNYIAANGANGLSTFNTTLRIAKTKSGTASQYCVPLRSGANIVITQRTSALNYLKLVLYNSGSKFKSGFSVTIRGTNYPI